jgi:hypothetical protein
MPELTISTSQGSLKSATGHKELELGLENTRITDYLIIFATFARSPSDDILDFTALCNTMSDMVHLS